MANESPEVTISKRYDIVVDFEATCWPEEQRRGDGEIIEFGCVRVEHTTARIIDEFQSFVRPTRYPRLSDFCTRLTSITQADVDTAPTFDAVYTAFCAWVGDFKNTTFCSWGALDQFLLRQACRFHRLPFPFDDEYVNIKPAFSDIYTGRGVSMPRALEIMEIPATGRMHRAIDDARSIARLWRAILSHRMAHG